MFDDEAAFLRAICENPEDDTLRLVFADWLDEQGGEVDAAWANGIREQVRCGSGGTDFEFPAPPDLSEPSHGSKKLKERLGIPPELHVNGWERGFPTLLGGHFTSIAQEWPRIAILAPWRTLRLSWTDDNSTASFVMWPWIARLKSLEFLNGDHTEATLLILARCAALRGLENLTVVNIYFTDEGTRTLLDSQHLTNLRQLRLYRRWDCPDPSPPILERLRTRFGRDVLG